MSDYCIVCAEPLQFTAYGVCGHKETCSKCVSRLRSVLKDVRCVYCQQQLPAVFVTRFAGDFTQQLPPDAFDTLQARADAGEFYYLPSAQAYFDDVSHYEEIKALCSFSHPKAGPRPFPSLRALKAALQSQHKLQFCDICLEGRKVFLSEQLVYTRAELDRHQRQGDVEGPLAESGFKGHPDCRFCRKRFYGENELYTHMHSTHEECFLCRRAHPHRHVYYRDYPDLEAHFKRDHYLCEHPECLERKFVVFASEQDLKTHSVREHGQTLSRAERRAALTLPVTFSYRRGGDANEPQADGRRGGGGSASDLAAIAASGQGAVVIGGAASLTSQLARGQQRRSRSELAALEQQHIAAAASASMESGNQRSSTDPDASDASGVLVTESEFPSFGAAMGGAPAVGGRWVGTGAPSASGVGGGLRSEDFPALPGMSKSAKRRAAKDRKTAAQMVGGGGAPRVLHVGRNANGGAFRGSGGAHAAASEAEHFPALGAPLPGKRQEDEDDEWKTVPRCPLPRVPSSQEVAEPGPSGREGRQQRRQQQQQQQQRGGIGGEIVGGGLSRPPGRASASPEILSESEGVSEALRAANRALIEKIKKRLGDEKRFAEFRRQSALWVKNEIDSKSYHAAITSLGLVTLVPELASTCPNAAKRDELLAVHASAFSEQSSPSGAASGSWMPPEAAAAAAREATAKCSWNCEMCTLVNAPAAFVCEACGHARANNGANNRWTQKVGSLNAQPAAPKGQPTVEEAFPALSLGTGSSANGNALGSGGRSGGDAAAVDAESSQSNGNKGKKKSSKVSLQNFVRSTPVDPQNVWRNPGLRGGAQGQWAAAGKLAQEERALNDAWKRN